MERLSGTVEPLSSSSSGFLFFFSVCQPTTSQRDDSANEIQRHKKKQTQTTHTHTHARKPRTYIRINTTRSSVYFLLVFSCFFLKTFLWVFRPPTLAHSHRQFPNSPKVPTLYCSKDFLESTPPRPQYPPIHSPPSQSLIHSLTHSPTSSYLFVRGFCQQRC